MRHCQPAGRAVAQRVGRKILTQRAAHRHRAVARQPTLPALVPDLERGFDQQAAEAGAVDEEVSLHALAAFQLQRLDEAVLGTQPHIHDLTVDATYAALLGVVAQITAVQRGIEVIGVVEARQHHRGIGQRLAEAAVARQRPGHGVVLDRHRAAPGPLAQPVLMERYRIEVFADAAERVEVAMAGPDPVDEPDAELEGAARGRDEGILVETELPVEMPDRRDGGLADADGADGRGLDHLDATAAARRVGERRRRHPAR